MSKHTPLPWKAWPVDGTLWVGGEKGYTVEFEDGDDALLAAVAVNNHAKLVETLEWLTNEAIYSEYDVENSEDLRKAIDSSRALLSKLDGETK